MTAPADGLPEPKRYDFGYDPQVKALIRREAHGGAGVYVLAEDYDLLRAKAQELQERGDYWADLYQREGESHRQTKEALAAAENRCLELTIRVEALEAAAALSGVPQAATPPSQDT